ncbi:putative dienelactone hydrolase [Rhizobium tibeticum]|uniref:alpha/beta hydrolase family protein n=1 Tax=Rhizobium tibeticum TaxID=501024 RepID=UPI0027884746|nr:alpha/beta fold hydrolase [Rhizobium tibeticum]MDP9812128.1 putative dienelactone hydrolase [Rhizobium tibeticum]
MFTRLRALFCLLLVVTFSAYPASAASGFREMTIPGTESDHPLHLSLWYPTGADTETTQLGETPAFVGLPVIRDADPAPGPHPLVILSHGYGGSWRNLAWLASELVDRGYVVAAPDHPGTTTFDMAPADTVTLWKRPTDISRAIDAVLGDITLTGPIAANRIAAIGHSLGGWTVVELAGGRFDAEGVMTDCFAQFGAIYCKIFAALGVGRDPAATAALGADLSDSRLGAIVTLDLGPGRGFTPQSLAAVQIPVLVLSAGEDIDPQTAQRAGIAATNKDSYYLAGHLPFATTQFTLVAGALHFSFMQLCKPGAAALIEEEAPGESIVCRDGAGADRQSIHRQVSDMTLAFLARALAAK